MKTIKNVIAILFVASLCMPLTKAQPSSDKRQEAQTTNKIAQDVLIIIQQEQVRFTTQKAVEEMRLQIFDQAGQPVYDSGAVTGQELTWVLRQAARRSRAASTHTRSRSKKQAPQNRGCAEAISSLIGPGSVTGRRIGSGSRARMTAKWARS